MSIVVYDEETADLDPDFGQILQMGVIVTDEDLNTVSEHNLRARRQPWVIPSPAALLTTGITPQQLENGRTIYEIIREFDFLLRQNDDPLKSAGYNSMSFDEAGLRAAFHQNLLETKFMTGLNEDGKRRERFDVMTLVKAAMMHAPEVLKLDIKTAKGNPSISLGNVCRQNGVELSEEDAHEAVADVKGTIGIAKLIRDNAPDLWKHMMSLTTQEGVEKLTKKNSLLCFSDISYGRPESKMVVAIASRKGHDTDLVMFDLSKDPKEYLGKSVDELASILGKRRSEPFFSIASNEQPILLPASMVDQDKYPQGLDEKTLQARADMIRKDKTFQKNIAEAAAKAKGNFETPKHIEKQLYEDIPEETELLLEQWKKDFHSGDWEHSVEVMDQFPALFKDALKETPSIKRFHDFAKRIIFDNAPELMDPADLAAYKSAIHQRVMDENPPRDMMTIPAARKELAKMREEAKEGKCRFIAKGEESKLDDLDAYYDSLEAKYAPSAPSAKPKKGGPSPSP